MSTLEKNAKIIATIGPVSRNKEMIWKLHQAGANIFRMNFSHPYYMYKCTKHFQVYFLKNQASQLGRLRYSAKK